YPGSRASEFCVEERTPRNDPLAREASCVLRRSEFLSGELKNAVVIEGIPISINPLVKLLKLVCRFRVSPRLSDDHRISLRLVLLEPDPTDPVVLSSCDHIRIQLQPVRSVNSECRDMDESTRHQLSLNITEPSGVLTSGIVH